MVQLLSLDTVLSLSLEFFNNTMLHGLMQLHVLIKMAKYNLAFSQKIAKLNTPSIVMHIQ